MQINQTETASLSVGLNSPDADRDAFKLREYKMSSVQTDH